MAKVKQRWSSTECGWGIVVVIAAHLDMALLYGLLRYCSVMYVSWQSEFNTSAQETAVVQSVLSAFMSFSGIAGGMLTKRFGCRFSGMFGGFLVSIGLFSSRWVTSIRQLSFTAVIIGTGIGIAYNPGIAAVAFYFKKHYEIANAIAYSGCGTGVIALPPLIQLLLDRYGWRDALLVMSAIMAHVVAIGALFRPIRPAPRRKSAAVTDVDDGPPEQGASDGATDNRATIRGDTAQGTCNDHDYIEVTTTNSSSPAIISTTDECAEQRNDLRLLLLSSICNRVVHALGLIVLVQSYRFALLCFVALEMNIPYMGFVLFIMPRAQSNNISPFSAAILLSVSGVGDLIGRLLNGALIGSTLSAENVNALSLFLGGVALLVTNADTYACYVLASFLHGFATGVFYATTVLLTRRLVGLRRFAVSTGLNQFSMGIGVIIGPIFSGWLFDETANYDVVFSVQAAVYFACAVQMTLLPLLKRIEPEIEPDD